MRKKLKTNVNYTKIMGFDFSCLIHVMNIYKISRQNQNFPSSHYHIQDMKKKKNLLYVLCKWDFGDVHNTYMLTN